MNINDAVLVHYDGTLRFGIIEEIITVTNRTGEQTSYNVSVFELDDKPRGTTCDEDSMHRLDDLKYYTDVVKVFGKSEGYQWAIKEQEVRKNPPAPPAPTPVQNPDIF